MTLDLDDLDAVGQAALVAEGEVTSLELVEAAIARVARLEPTLHALVSQDVDGARARARAGVQGPLAGVPFLIKDLLGYPGQRLTLGARFFRNNIAAQGSPLTSRFDGAGLICLGKTTTSELGLLGSTETLLSGPTQNPWQLGYSAAGSSGGAAAAVASGMVPMAHASDAGGSIRIPASVCGVFGFKPSRGREASDGQPDPLGLGLLSEHCVSRSVRDSALLLSLTEDPQNSARKPVGYVRAPLTRGLRIGAYHRTLLGREADPEVREALAGAVRLCESLGHSVVQCDGPAVDGAALSAAFFALAGAGIAQLSDMLSPMLGRAPGPDELEPFTLALRESFLSSGAEAIPRALAAIAAGRAAMQAFLAEYDAVLCPTLPVLPPKLGFLAPTLPRETIIERTEVLAGFTAIHNMAGVPAMSVPLGMSRTGLPIGIHFSASLDEDALLLGLAYQLEAAAPWAQRRPTLMTGKT
jgi:amidase